MKKITEETLNAIQENVRTRETQELDYRRENLFKGSWKDFKIKDLKPNLIPNGWDSFEPYDGSEVKITPLGNGLTRIQTWGGNSPFKLQSYGGGYWESGKTYTFSLYLLSEQNIGIRLFNSGSHLIWSNDFPDYINHTVEQNRKVADITHISAKNVGDNLDFIASDPIINEGDKPNPTLIVTELDDGREHVQVYGTTKDTKLVYSGNEGFIGEDYGLKTTIENNGIDLDFSTSLIEEKKRIEKGENKVNLQGELSTKLSIEIGVPSE